MNERGKVISEEEVLKALKKLKIGKYVELGGSALRFLNKEGNIIVK